MVWRSSLISWILFSILVLKSKGTVKIPRMLILCLIGSSTKQTRTHLLNSCIRLSPVASMNGPLEQPQNFEGKEVDGECRPEL